MAKDPMPIAEVVAASFHAAYEQLAPAFGYETREASAKPWADVPQQNKRLMIAVAAELLSRGVITAHDARGHVFLAETAREIQRTKVAKGA